MNEAFEGWRELSPLHESLFRFCRFLLYYFKRNFFAFACSTISKNENTFFFWIIESIPSSSKDRLSGSFLPFLESIHIEKAHLRIQVNSRLFREIGYLHPGNGSPLDVPGYISLHHSLAIFSNCFKMLCVLHPWMQKRIFDVLICF